MGHIFLTWDPFMYPQKFDHQSIFPYNHIPQNVFAQIDMTINTFYHFGLHGPVFVDAPTSLCPLARGPRQWVVHLSCVYKTLFPANVFFLFFVAVPPLDQHI